MAPGHTDPVLPIIDEIKVAYFEQEGRRQIHPFMVSPVHTYPTFRGMSIPRQAGAIEVLMAIRSVLAYKGN